MAMTAQVKAELASTQVTKSCCRKAEVSSMLRFAGGLHIVERPDRRRGRARHRRRRPAAAPGHRRGLRPPLATSSWSSGHGIRKGSRYVVRVVKDGEALARQTGLLDGRGRPVRGLPPQVVSGGSCDAVAAWRGAFLAHGSLTEPGRSSALEVTCPGPEAALALVGAARRLGISAKAREVRGVDRVVIRDGDAIGALLTRLGAHESLMAWEERRMRREVRATANRLANFDDANLRRSARAAVAAGARVERALEILGDDVPDHLQLAGALRLEHKQASLEELGQLHDPALTKDAIAGRIRRLLAMADKRAQDLGIPDTEAQPHPGDARRAERAEAGARCLPSTTRVGGLRREPRARGPQTHRLATPEGARHVTVRVGINGFGRIGRNFFRAVRAPPAPTSRSSPPTTSTTTRPWRTCSSTTRSSGRLPTRSR